MRVHETPRNRRRVLKSLGAGIGAATLAGCAGGGGGDTPTPRIERETVVRERTVVQERTVDRTPTESELSRQHAIEAEDDVIRDWMDQDKVDGNFDYDQGYADDNYRLVEMLHDAEAFETPLAGGTDRHP